MLVDTVSSQLLHNHGPSPCRAGTHDADGWRIDLPLQAHQAPEPIPDPTRPKRPPEIDPERPVPVPPDQPLPEPQRPPTPGPTPADDPRRPDRPDHIITRNVVIPTQATPVSR